MSNFIRYIVKVIDRHDHVLYISIGTGMTSLVENAHIYTTHKLAKNKALALKNDKRWYKDAKVIPCFITIEE